MYVKREMKKFIKKYIMVFLWERLEKYVGEYVFIQNINKDINSGSQKKVLISYLTEPFGENLNGHIRHTNIAEATVIVKVFVELGYCIDIIHCRDNIHLAELKDNKYDVIFGFGEPFFLAAQYNPYACRILYLTESSPDYSKKNELERIRYFQKRHNKSVSLRRSGLYYNNKYFDFADVGILIGNEWTAESYRIQFPEIPLFLLNPTGLKNERFSFHINKTSQKAFVWFGSDGAIHKGLDVLLDAFKDTPEAMLFVCGVAHDEKWLLRRYQKYSNIIDVGFVNVQTTCFLDIINKADFVIFPSASEGMSTSVLTCMRHGLIPVVTRSTGINVQGFGFYLDDYHVEYICEVIKKLINYPETQLKEMRKTVYSYTNKNFCLKTFKNKFSKICAHILENSNHNV